MMEYLNEKKCNKKSYLHTYLPNSVGFLAKFINRISNNKNKSM